MHNRWLRTSLTDPDRRSDTASWQVKQMAAEEAALRLRLQAKEVALRSLTKKYLAFSNAIEKSSVEECEAMHEALILEIKTYEFSISKGSLLVDTNVQQVAEYDAMQQDVEAMMCAPPVQHHRLSPLSDCVLL